MRVENLAHLESWNEYLRQISRASGSILARTSSRPSTGHDVFRIATRLLPAIGFTLRAWIVSRCPPWATRVGKDLSADTSPLTRSRTLRTSDWDEADSLKALATVATRTLALYSTAPASFKTLIISAEPDFIAKPRAVIPPAVRALTLAPAVRSTLAISKC